MMVGRAGRILVRNLFHGFLLLGVILGVLWGAIYLDRLAGRPDATTASSPISAKEARAEETASQSLATPYFSTSVPSSYRLQFQSSASADASRLSIIATSQVSKDDDEQLVFISDLLPATGLSGVADYNLRTDDQLDYSLLQGIFPSDVAAFRSNIDGSITLFLTQANRYVSITASGGPTEDLTTLLNQALAGWIWK